jgi:hypothetical protein
MSADGPADVTDKVLVSYMERFELLEEMIEGLGPTVRAD